MTDFYNDIRPYRDHEVSAVVDTLLSDNNLSTRLSPCEVIVLPNGCPGSCVYLLVIREVTACGVSTVDGFR